MWRHFRHVGGQKQYIFSPLGNKIYFHAKLFHCFSPPTWPPCKPFIVKLTRFYYDYQTWPTHWFDNSRGAQRLVGFFLDCFFGMLTGWTDKLRSRGRCIELSYFVSVIRFLIKFDFFIYFFISKHEVETTDTKRTVLKRWWIKCGKFGLVVSYMK